jgi:hypothetical protein
MCERRVLIFSSHAIHWWRLCLFYIWCTLYHSVSLVHIAHATSHFCTRKWWPHLQPLSSSVCMSGSLCVCVCVCHTKNYFLWKMETDIFCSWFLVITTVLLSARTEYVSGFTDKPWKCMSTSHFIHTSI